jgi:hypothetical protein
VRLPALLVAGLIAGTPAVLPAQGSLEEAVGRVKSAWLDRDFAGLRALADTVVVGLPGSDPAVAQGPAQAVKLLQRYLEPAREVGFEVRVTRRLGGARGYAEGVRRYVVRGTSDELEETVLFGFELSAGQWRLSEIRIAP